MHTGGPGAPEADAWLTTVHIGDLGLCYLDSVELDELRYPIRVHGRGILTRQRGRRPLSRRAERLLRIRPGRHDHRGLVRERRHRQRAHGCQWRRRGRPLGPVQARRDGALTEVPPCGGVVLAPGETLVSLCCGGGGYGNPLDRDARSVAEDVAEGWITRERAAEIYGVELTEAGAVDERRTAQRRGDMGSSGGKIRCL